MYTHTHTHTHTHTSNLFLVIFFLVTSFSTFEILAKPSGCHFDKCSDVVKYVQGGLCNPGDGSKKHPYNSLQLAEQDTSWQTLVVLPSPFALDGGISMRPGTQLIGAKNPLDGSVSAVQPRITNTSDVTNGGNGVVVQSGDVCIENIYFQDTWASGINYDNARNLSVKNVLITGANQANLTAFIPDGSGIVYAIGGIQAESTQNGCTHLYKVVVRDCISGQGIAESIRSMAKREFNASKCEFSGLGQSVVIPNVLNRVGGILLLSAEKGTEHSAKISKCYFHDYSRNSVNNVRHAGVSLQPRNGSYLKCLVDQCGTYNLGAPGVNHNGFGIYQVAQSILSPDKTVTRLCVENCHFEEVEQRDSAGIQCIDFNAISHVTIKNNWVINFLDSITSYIGGNSINSTKITGNNIVGSAETIFAALAYSSGQGSFGSSITQKVIIKNNNFVGASNIFGAILVIPDYSPGNNWKNLVINMENNCLSCQQPGPGEEPAAIVGYDFGSNGVGNGTINAHHNNITNFVYDIADVSANVNYLASKNWWGQPSGPDPDQILTTPGYTGILDVSKPLQNPVHCPKTKYCIADFSEFVARPNVTSQNVSTREARFEEVKQRWLNKEIM